MSYDVTIVGSGFGGLISGALLSKQGFKVAVFEKHDKPGGFATHFKRKGYTFEVAVHSIEGFSKKNIRSLIFEYLELDKRVNFLKVENMYRLHGFKGYLDIPSSVEGAREALKSKYPCEAVGIDTFFDTMLLVSDEFYQYQLQDAKIDFENPMFPILFPTVYKLLQVPLSIFIAATVANVELRWLLISNIGFFHHDPSRYSAAYFLLKQSHYLLGGTVYTEGGTQKICDALVDIIRENGGSVELKSEVTKVEYGLSKSVRTHIQPVSKNKENFSVESKYCIINAATPYACEKLLNSESAVPQYPVSTSATTLYLGLNKPLHESYPFDFFNFFTQKGLKSGAETDNLDFSLIDASIVDKTISRQKKYTTDVVFLDSYERWEKAYRKGQYEDLKHLTVESILKRLKKVIPKIDEHIEVFELGTPMTIKRYTNNPGGAAYAFDLASIPIGRAMEGFSVHNKPVFRDDDRILFASSWSSHFHGLTGASLAGFQAVNTIFNKEGVVSKIL